MPTITDAIEIFCSYSHKDEELRNELEKCLVNLKRQGLIFWHDRKISAGTEWSEEIDTHINSAKIILLLISQDFLASDYCVGVEVNQALERHEAKEARVIPIILKPADWEETSLGKLGKLQALPKDAKPISTWKDRDKAFLDVVRQLRVAVGEMAVKEQGTCEDKKTPAIGKKESNPGKLEEAPGEYRDAIRLGPNDAAVAHNGKHQVTANAANYIELENGTAETDAPQTKWLRNIVQHIRRVSFVLVMFGFLLIVLVIGVFFLLPPVATNVGWCVSFGIHSPNDLPEYLASLRQEVLALAKNKDPLPDVFRKHLKEKRIENGYSQPSDYMMFLSKRYSLDAAPSHLQLLLRNKNEAWLWAHVVGNSGRTITKVSPTRKIGPTLYVAKSHVERFAEKGHIRYLLFVFPLTNKSLKDIRTSPCEKIIQAKRS